MWKRLVVLWLLLPPSGQMAAWADVLPHACGHEFCTCLEHCERKPVSEQPCHDARPEIPTSAMSDACHAGEARELLALQIYLLPRPEASFALPEVLVILQDRTRSPEFGFERIDLPPPRV